MALAKLINQFPQRSEIGLYYVSHRLHIFSFLRYRLSQGISAENSVAALENELTMLDATAASLEQRRALRQRQASVLLNAIADLQKELDDNSDAMS
jgi:citrate lyase synthetase